MGRGQYGAVDEEQVARAVDHAIDNGVTLFDTAAAYGWGAGEELLGKFLRGRRDQVVLVSKGGVPWNESEKRYERISSREQLTEDLEGSLRRLQTDYLDLYLIHWPDESRFFSEPMEAIADFQSQGKIRYGGVSNFSAEQVRESLETFPIICNQVGYHLFDTRSEPEIFPFCAERGLGVMAYGSLAHGLLTGTMTRDTKFGPDDWRRELVVFEQPLFEGEHFLKNLLKVDKLKEYTAQTGRTVAQLAIAWVLSNPVVSVALTGVRNPTELEQNVEAADWILTEGERAEVTGIAGHQRVE